MPDTESFRNAFGLAVGRKNYSEKTFFGLYDEFTNQEGRENSWVKATYQKTATVKNRMFHLAKMFSQYIFVTN